MANKFPNSLAGLYEINFSDLILKSIKLSDTELNDIPLREIRFESGIGYAVYENKFSFILNMKYDQAFNTYSFTYKGNEHLFEVKASLAGACRYVTIINLSEFNSPNCIDSRAKMLNTKVNQPFIQVP